jgi:hypothetical protein
VKNGNDKEQVEQQTRCLACGAVWARGFIRRSLFKMEPDKGIDCPFCDAKGKAVRELVNTQKA